MSTDDGLVTAAQASANLNAAARLMGFSLAELEPALRAVADAMRLAARPHRRFAFLWRLAALRVNARRLNGRPRRSGNRHRGTSAWDRRAGR